MVKEECISMNALAANSMPSPSTDAAIPYAAALPRGADHSAGVGARPLKLETPAIADGRNATLRSLTDAFVGRHRSARPEIAHYRSIAFALLPHVNSGTRAYVAAALAQSSHAPADLLDALCDHDLSVSKPILSRSRAIDPDRLATLARDGSTEHVELLMQRQDLPESVMDALIDRLDPDTDAALLGRQMANLTLDQITVLASRDDFSAEAAGAFIDNHTLNRAQLAELFWVSGAEMRLVIVADFAAQGRERASGLSESVGKLAGSAARALVMLAREKRFEDLVAGIARLGNIDRVTAARIIRDRGGEALCVTGRALGLPLDAMEDLLSAFGHARAGTLKPLMELYTAIPAGAAHAMLDHWYPERGTHLEDKASSQSGIEATVVHKKRPQSARGAQPAQLGVASQAQRKRA
jgi:uncharacterized protein (DUF2336 family)